MRQVTTTKIDDCTYDFYMLGPKDALRVLTRITRLLGEPLAAVLGDVVSGKSSLSEIIDSKIDEVLKPEMLREAVAALVSRLDEDLIVQTIDQLLTPVWVQAPEDKGTHKMAWEAHFHGRIGHLMKVLKATLEANYSDFFGGGGDKG